MPNKSVLQRFRDKCDVAFGPSKPCCLCKKPMYSALPDWSANQPVSGGEVIMYFGIGSKLARNTDQTCFNGIICDECAKKLVGQMEDISQ